MRTELDELIDENKHMKEVIFTALSLLANNGPNGIIAVNDVLRNATKVVDFKDFTVSQERANQLISGV